MKGRILSIALGLSLLTIVFASVPTNAAVYYTGSVQPTDDAGNAKTVFVQGEYVYVSVLVEYEGDPIAEDILVELVDHETGGVEDWIWATTDDPATGSYNSWESVPIDYLNSGWTTIDGDLGVFDVVLFVDQWGWWTETARTPIVIRAEGLSMDPYPEPGYWPGEEVTMTLVTTYPDHFYVQVVDEAYDPMVVWEHQETVDSVWTTVWTVNDTLVDGWYMVEVRAESDDSLMYTSYFEDDWTNWFEIMKYELLVSSDRYMVLPGETVTISYEVIDVATLEPATDVVIEWRAVWTNDTDVELNLTGDIVTVRGTMTLVIPADIALYSDVVVHFWANDSTDRSQEATLYFSIGTIAGSVYTDSDTYYAGDKVRVSVYAAVSWDSIPDADVDVTVSKDGTVIATYGATNLLTGYDGYAEYAFDLATDADKGDYVVSATITKSGYSLTRMDSFTVEWDGSIEVEFDKEYYYSGDLATFTVTVIFNNEVVDGENVLFMIYTSDGWQLNGNTDTGSGSYQIAADYVGWVEVDAVCEVEGMFFEDWDWVNVYVTGIVLSVDQSYYRPGDELTYNFELMTARTSGSLSYVIEDVDGTTVDSGDLEFAESGEFVFEVPSEDASTRYLATLTYDDGAGNVEEDYVYAWLIAEFEIEVWLESKPKFTSGAFEPGSTVTIGYRINTYGAEPLPLYQLSYYSYDDDVTYNILITELSGEIDFPISDESPNGEIWVDINLYDPVEDDWLSDDQVIFDVRANQSAWDRSVGGMSLADFMILLLLVIVVLVLIVMPLVKGRMGKPKAVEPVPPPPEQGKSPP